MTDFLNLLFNEVFGVKLLEMTFLFTAGVVGFIIDVEGVVDDGSGVEDEVDGVS